MTMSKTGGAQQNTLFIQNARVYPMDRPCIENGYIFVQNGRIAALGPMQEAPVETGHAVLDAQGGYLLPGLVDAHTHLGLYEDSLGMEGADGNEDTDPVTPHLRVIDGINPMDRAFQEAREAGVTTVAVSPGSANPIGGEIAVLKTTGRRVDDMLLRAPAAIKFALGENPKTVYREKEQTPVTRMATAALIREQLQKAREYQARKQRAALDEDDDGPDFDPKLEALLPLLQGEIEAHFHAHRADDLFTALRIAREFSLRPVLVHGTEAHLVADLMQDVPVISGPFLTDRSKPELANLTEKAPGLLVRAGVQTAITTDHPEIPLRLLLHAAMLAVRAGMEEIDALRAITLHAARIAGVEDRVGSITPGKDGDLVLFRRHPFDYKSEVEAVFCEGKCVFRRE